MAFLLKISKTEKYPPLYVEFSLVCLDIWCERVEHLYSSHVSGTQTFLFALLFKHPRQVRARRVYH